MFQHLEEEVFGRTVFADAGKRQGFLGGLAGRDADVEQRRRIKLQYAEADVGYFFFDRIYRIVRIIKAKLALRIVLCDLCVLCG